MTAYLSALVICLVSVVIGAALRPDPRGWSWTAPPVGLAAAVLIALVTVRLPGHGATAAAAIALATLAAAVALVRRRAGAGPLVEGLPVAAAALLLCSLPFIANGRMGELGAYILDDLSFHLAQADGMDRIGAAAHATTSGYPVGPHGLVAALGGVGVGVSSGFTGLLLATPVLTALTALAAFRAERRVLAGAAAVLVGAPYLAASYTASGAFKEPLLALFVLGFVLVLRERGRGGTLAMLLCAAGGVAVFGAGGLAWPAAVLAWVGVLRLLRGERPRVSPALVGAGLTAAAAVCLAAVVAGFFDSGPGRWLTDKGTGGNFSGQLSPLEALGYWRRPDFREGMADPLLQPGVLLALAVVLVGLVWCWRRREHALLAGGLAAISIYAVARPVTLAYFSGKALAVAAPILTLIGLRALVALASASQPRRLAVAAGATLALYLLAAGASSALVLRAARVRPHERGTDLAAFRPIVDGRRTLYLGRDNYAQWELRGSRLQGFQSNDTPLGSELLAVPSKRATDEHKPAADIDSPAPLVTAYVRYVVAPRTGFASAMPPQFRPVARTRWHVLWKRRGLPGPRRTLAEGEAPGRVLDCSTASGRRLARTPGEAWVRPRPVVGAASEWRPRSTAVNGETREQQVELPPGRWQLSLRWFSDVPLTLRAGGLRATVPAYLGDAASFAAVGSVTSAGGPLRVSITVPGRSRVEVERTVRLGALAFTRPGGRLVPLARACGRYVDWYRTP